MPIKGVTFDLWLTLITDSPDLGSARLRARLDGTGRTLKEAGESFSGDQLNEAHQRCARTCQDIRAQGRDISFMDQVRIFVEYIQSGLTARLGDVVVERIATVYAESLFAGPPPLHAAAATVLHDIKKKGYRLGLISNTGMTPGATFRTYMEQIGILGVFEVLTFSDEVLVAKPAGEIFHRTAQSLGFPVDEIVHIGDDLRTDVVGAHGVGMKTVWIEGGADIRDTLDFQPDATVRSLAEVGSAIDSLARASP